MALGCTNTLTIRSIVANGSAIASKARGRLSHPMDFCTEETLKLTNSMEQVRLRAG